MTRDKEVNRVLRDPFKATDEAKGITKALALIWRTILKNYNIDPTDYSELVTDYLRDPRNRISMNPNKRNSIRSNLADALFKPSARMTWNTLTKGFNILRITRLKITLETERENHPTLVHYIDINVRDEYLLVPVLKQDLPPPSDPNEVNPEAGDDDADWKEPPDDVGDLEDMDD